MRQKLILFVVMFVVYGVIMVPMFKLYANNGLKVPILTAFCFALIVTSALLIIQRTNLKRTGQSNVKIKINVELVLEIEASQQDAFQLCTHALAEVKKCVIGLSNAKKGVITATTGVNWLTWGEELNISIVELTEHQCVVTLASHPKVKTTLIDYGKNRDNIMQMVRYIKQSPYKINAVRDESGIVQSV